MRTETQYPSWPTTSPTLVTNSTYDQNSNRLTLQDPKGQTTSSLYDALNRLTSLTYSDGTTPNVTYGYDQNDNRTSMTDSTGTTTYAYDELDRPTAITSPGSSTVGYRYDLHGNRVKVIYPDGTAVTSTFNQASQLASLADWASRSTSYQYFPDGSLKQATKVDGTTASYLYDNAVRLTQVSNQLGTSILDQHLYTLDALGNRTKVQETLASPGTQDPSAWGLNTSGQIGKNATQSVVVNPTEVVSTSGSGNLGAIGAIAAGGQHSLAIRSDGSVVYSWRLNTHGQLGTSGTATYGTSSCSRYPVTVGGLSGTISQVSGGVSHSLAVKSDGTAWAWGANGSGQLGDNQTPNSTNPVPVVGSGGTGTLGNVTAIAGGSAFSVAMKSDGSVWTWGDDTYGELGTNTHDTNAHPSPAQVEGIGGSGTLGGIVGIAAGASHAVAVQGNGSVLAWGLGTSGQLGTNATQSKATPIQVVGVGGSGTLGGQTLIAAGADHTLALATTRQVTTSYGDDRLYRLTSGGTPGTPNAYTYDPVGNRLSLTQGNGAAIQSTYDKADRLLTVGVKPAPRITTGTSPRILASL